MYDKKFEKKERGFVALLSVVIICLALLLAVVGIGQRGIAGRFALLDLERKAQADSYARGCVEMARVSVGNDPSYAVSNRTLIVGSGTCTLVSVSANTPTLGQSRIQATSTVNGSHTRLEAVINASTGAIITSHEVLAF